MFNIRNSRDFYEKLLQEFAELQDNPSSARAAINCAISAYHLHEWVWGDWLKNDYATWKKLGIRDKESFLAWIDRSEPFFPVLQALANGSKHFDRQISRQTKVAGAFDSAAFDQHAFDTTRLEIEVDGKWILADVLFNDVVLFWRDFLRNHGPYKELPTPQAHLTEFK
jgi:hypothetical protein